MSSRCFGLYQLSLLAMGLRLLIAGGSRRLCLSLLRGSILNLLRHLSALSCEISSKPLEGIIEGRPFKSNSNFGICTLQLLSDRVSFALRLLTSLHYLLSVLPPASAFLSEDDRPKNRPVSWSSGSSSSSRIRPQPPSTHNYTSWPRLVDRGDRPAASNRMYSENLAPSMSYTRVR